MFYVLIRYIVVHGHTSILEKLTHGFPSTRSTCPPCNTSLSSSAVHLCFQIGSSIFVSGSIGLDAGSMRLIPGGVLSQAQLALRHVDRVIKAIGTSCCLRDAMLVICYIVVPDHTSLVEDMLNESFVSRNSPFNAVRKIYTSILTVIFSSRPMLLRVLNLR